MLGTWRGNSNSWSMIDTLKNTFMPASSEVARGFCYNNALVEGDGTFNPASEDDIIEIKGLLAEPESVKISMDALLYYNNECVEECLGIGDVSGSAHQNNNLKFDTGTMQSDIPLYGNDLANVNFLDELLQGVKEEDLHVTGGLSSTSNELILDTKHIARFPKSEYACEILHSVNLSLNTCSPGLNERVIDNSEALDLSAYTMNPMPESTSDKNVLLHDKNFFETENGPGFLERETFSTELEGMLLRCTDDSYGTKSSFESCSPGLGERVTDGAEALDLSAGTINQVPESTSDQNILLFDNMTTHELHQAFESTFGLETTIKDRKWLISRISLGMQKFIEVEHGSSFLESKVSSTKHEDMHLRCNSDSHETNSSFDSCSSGLSERASDGAETLDLSAGTIPVSEYTSDQNGHLLDKLTIQELHYAFRSTFGLETTVKDRKWLTNRILNGLQNIVETVNVSGHLEREISSTKQVGMHLRCSNDSLRTDSSFASVVGNWAKPVYSTQTERITSLDVYKASYFKVNDTGVGLVSWRNREADKKRKRSRNPTRRCIEASDLKLRYCTEKLENRITSSKDTLNELSIQNRLKGLVEMAPICKQGIFGGSDTQITCGRRKTKTFANQNKSVRVHKDDLGDNENDKSLSGPEHCSDLESSHTERQDDMSETDDCISTVRTIKDLSRRKNHRLWTLSEVMKLIEGVSQHGVGRWAEIKRFLFTSSAHRTAIDLKDKWRNLLRASGAQLKHKRKVYIEQKGSQPIPQSVLKRVSELAIIHRTSGQFQART